MATGILDNIKEAVQASLNVSQMKTLTTPIIVDETEYSTVETALNAINSKSVDVDDELSAVSENPIQNKVITEEINKKLTVVDNMPTASAEFVGKQRLYVGESSGGLNKGGIYECRSDGNDGYEWVLISTADVDLSKYKKIFTGTRAEWDALTTTEKGEYDICNLTDDLAGGELVVSDTVTAGDMNPVTSNAVAKAVNYSTDEVKTGATWIDGKPIYRKVLNISTSAFTAGNNWVDISIPNLETVVDIKGVTKHNTSSSNYVLPVSPQDNTSRLMLDTISSSSLLVSVGSWWVENKIHYSELNVILEYTKTTD